MTSSATDRAALVTDVAIKAPCRAATTANITLSGAQTIDGVAIVADDRVLVKSQTTGADNGIYVADTGTWSRSTDFDSSRDVTYGTVVLITNGSLYANSLWELTTASPVIGTTSLTFTQNTGTIASSAAMSPVVNAATLALARTAMGVAASGANTDITSLSAPALGAATATTQATTDSSTKVATTAFVKSISPNSLQDFRLTLTSGLPVTVSDITAATTLYFTPDKGNSIALYDGSTQWNDVTSTEISIAVPSTTSTMYDVFCYSSSGTATLELTAWTNDTTRATNLAYQNGVLVKSGTTTRRFVGSFRTTTVSGQTEDSLTKRYLWNYYNRVNRPMRRFESTSSWNYTIATWRQANAAAANQLDFVRGVSEDAVTASVVVNVENATGTTVDCGVAMGLDSTSTVSASCVLGGSLIGTGTSVGIPIFAHYTDYPSAGRHYLAWLEISKASGTTSWLGTSGVSYTNQAGIIGNTWG